MERKNPALLVEFLYKIMDPLNKGKNLESLENYYWRYAHSNDC